MKNSLIIGLMAVFLVACQTTGVSFPTAKLSPTIEENSRTHALYFAPKGAGPFAVVVLLHACGGLTPHVTGLWPNFLTEIGYAVLSVDTKGSHPYDCQTTHSLISDISHDFIGDAYGALKYLKTRPDIDIQRTAVIGFSLGARVLNVDLPQEQLARSHKPNFRAAISFYAACPLNLNPPFPYLQIVGDKDLYWSYCVESAKYSDLVDIELIKGAHHAFDAYEVDGRIDPGGQHMVFSADATKIAQRAVKNFLDKHLNK